MHPTRLPSATLALATLLSIIPASSPVAAQPASPPSLLGADSILLRLADTSATPAAADPVAELTARVQAFARQSDALAPAEAADQWLALHDALFRIPAEAFYRQPYSDRLGFSRLIEALPAPEAWDALATALLARTEKNPRSRDYALRLLAHVLRGDSAAQTATLEELSRHLAADRTLEDYERESLLRQAEQLATTVAQSAGDAARLAAFTRELTRCEAPASGGDRDRSLQIPDLARLAPAAEVEPLLLRALRLDQEVYINHETTRTLAASLATREVASLPRPRWSLVRSLDDVALYEALAQKFPAPAASRRDRERDQATLIYIFGLIATDRVDDATRLVLDPVHPVPSSGFGYASRELFARLQREGRGSAVTNFLRDLLTRDPALPFWDNYIDIAARESRAPEALALLRTTLARPDLPPATADTLRARYVTALLAADQIDEGIALLRTLVAADQARPATPTADPAPAADPADPSAPPFAGSLPTAAELAALGVPLDAELVAALAAADDGSSRSEKEERLRLRVTRITLLFRLGRLLARADLTDEALAASRALFPTLGENDGYQASELSREYLKTLRALDRAPEAEAFLLDTLLRLRATETGSYRYRTPQALLELARLYHRADRHADVLRLFSGSPDWGAADLADLSEGSGEDAPLLLVADALVATGRAPEAVPLLCRHLRQNLGSDPAYARLEKIAPPDYQAVLENLARRDRFEERPLIWLARLHLAAGRLEEAERTARAAIAIDPSDGEQGKGDRLRAYAVLSDILAARGDAAQSAQLREAVAAIRLSEDADDWWAAGLLTRAIALYEKSLLRFADAYCIQSRLALRYNELGDFAKAEQHYRRAFELMPESFGRIESHCFGCEGAFDGPFAQGHAERVFTRLAAEFPERAQIFYLLGYLRSSQERFAEAANHYRRAVALDPDYLNAWEKLLALSSATQIPVTERETAALALLRLDPAGLHVRPDLSGLTDLRRLWTAIRAAEATLPPPEDGPLYPLDAVVARREALAKAGDDDAGGHDSYAISRRALNLRSYLSEHPLFSATAQFLENTLRH